MQSESVDGTEDAKTVLIIDDEAGMREGCRRALIPSGYVVDTAPDIATSRERLRHRKYDAYIIDVMLPDGSGLDLMIPILEEDPTAVCIIITGFASIAMAVEALRQGAHDFLSKPFTSEELLVAVNQGLERKRLIAIEAQSRDLAREKDELEKLDEFKSQLMLTLAHELRAPVAAVQSYINLILSGYVPQDEIHGTLTRVQERLQETLELIADLLELARLKQAQERPTLEMSPQDMAGALEEVTDLLRESAIEKKQNFEVNILDRPMIMADREHLKRLWTNLISNAIKYTPEGGQVTVQLQADDDSAVGQVEDSGIGMSDEDLSHLFQEFYRTDTAKASGEVGTGLGLSIVKQIVDMYQGQVSVTSVPGEGSHFTFILPLKQAPHETSEQETSLDDTRSPIQDRTPAGWASNARAFILGRDSSLAEEH